MKKTAKSLFLGAALVLAAVGAYATTTYYTVTWYGNPSAYTSSYGCTWNFYTSHGGSTSPGSYWVEFVYQPVGACAYTAMSITHNSGQGSSATAILTN